MQQGFDFLEVTRYLALLKPGARLDIRPYAYPFEFSTFTALSTQNVTRTLDSNCDFLWMATTLSPGDWIGSVGLQIKDNGSGEFFLPESLPLSFVGDSLQTAVAAGATGLPLMRLIPRNSTLVASLTELDNAAIGDTLQLVLHGVRVYEYS